MESGSAIICKRRQIPKNKVIIGMPFGIEPCVEAYGPKLPKPPEPILQRPGSAPQSIIAKFRNIEI